MSTTINKEEIQKFSRLAEEWWDVNGKFKPLHMFNPIRIEYILDEITKHFKLNGEKKNLLKNLEILDIGCGGGLISEPMARLGGNITGIDAAEKNIKIASLHSKESNLKINYLNNDLLSINDTLLIPLSKSKSNNFIPYEMYIVSEGDTLWSIAKQYNIEIRDLSRMNSIDENSYLQLGQQLSIGNKNIHRNMESKKRTILYSVKQGDNLFKISELFDVSIRSIEEINNFKNTTLMPGQIIKVAIRAF